jgi:hypothetical protein
MVATSALGTALSHDDGGTTLRWHAGIYGCTASLLVLEVTAHKVTMVPTVGHHQRITNMYRALLRPIHRWHAQH